VVADPTRRWRASSPEAPRTLRTTASRYRSRKVSRTAARRRCGHQLVREQRRVGPRRGVHGEILARERTASGPADDRRGSRSPIGSIDPTNTAHGAHARCARPPPSNRAHRGANPTPPAHPAVRFARLIQRPVRVLGGPIVRAAFGGNLSLPWLPHRVITHAMPRSPNRPTGRGASAQGTQSIPINAAASSIRVDIDGRYAIVPRRDERRGQCRIQPQESPILADDRSAGDSGRWSGSDGR
jgi:hypothetical protein